MKIKKILAVMMAISMLFASASFASETEYVSATQLGRPIYSDGTTYESFPHFEGQWIQDSIGWRFQKTDGNFVSGMVAWIKGRYYHFNANGYMDTGVVMTEDGYYKYFASDGSQRFNQWVYWNGGYYYAGNPEAHIIGPVLTNRYVDGYWVGADGRWDGKPAVSNQQVAQAQTQNTEQNNAQQNYSTATQQTQSATVDVQSEKTYGGYTDEQLAETAVAYVRYIAKFPDTLQIHSITCGTYTFYGGMNLDVYNNKRAVVVYSSGENSFGRRVRSYDAICYNLPGSNKAGQWTVYTNFNIHKLKDIHEMDVDTVLSNTTDSDMDNMSISQFY